MDVEKELEKMLTEKELPKVDEKQEAVKRLPPRWVAISPSSFNQVEEETKILRKYVPEEEEEQQKLKKNENKTKK